MEISDKKMLTHLPKLRRYARALTGDELQGDALTEKTMDCATSLANFRPKDTPLSVWLFSVMHNLTVDFLSEFYDDVSSKSILPYIKVEDLSVDGDPIDPDADIKTALAHLTLEQKEILLLTSLEKLNYDEVIKIMACKHANFIQNLDTARHIMCTYLFDDHFEDLQQVQWLNIPII